MNIHHFCSQTNSVELPAHLTRVSRDMHTVDKHKVVSERYREPRAQVNAVISIFVGLQVYVRQQKPPNPKKLTVDVHAV